MSAPMSKKQFLALAKAERAVLLQKPKRRRPRRGRNPRQAQKVVMVAANAPRRNGQRRRRGGRRQRGGRGPGGIDGVGIMRGGEIVNKRTRSPPEIRDGEELVATVLGSVGFTTTQFNINPANAITFPWLSKIAQLFERYEFEELSFHFGHDVSGFATQGQTGLVYLSALYDAASAAPTSVTQIEATDPFVPAMPNQDSCCRLDKKSMHPSNEPKYCLQGNPPPGATDIKTYNVGNLFVSTTGMANATEIGKLRVRYRVRLFDRILDASQTSAPANFAASWFQSTAAQTMVNTVPTVSLNATATNNGLGIVNTAGSFVPPAGNYLVTHSCRSADSSAEITLAQNDLLKNGTSVYQTVADKPIQALGIALGAASNQFTSNTVFVTANGSDAFTQTITLNGAAGTLTAATTVLWVAV